MKNAENESFRLENKNTVILSELKSYFFYPNILLKIGQHILYFWIIFFC